MWAPGDSCTVALMIQCTACRHDNPDGSGFCEGCGAALHDPKKAAREADEVEAEFMLDQAKKGRSAFFVIGSLQLLAAGIEATMVPDGLGVFALIAGVILAGLFFLLAWWCSRQPFIASIIGLFLFAGLHVLAAVNDPATIYKGIIVKGIVIMMLVRAVKAGFAHREFVRSRGMG